MAEALTWVMEHEEALRAALGRPWWQFRFPAELEAHFDKAIAEKQARQSRNNYILALLFCDLFALADYYFLPDVYQIAWFIRFALITPLFVLVIWAEFYSHHTFRRGVATLFLLVFVTLGLMYPVVISKGPDVVHYHVGLLVVIVFSNLLTDMRFALALIGSALFSVIYVLELAIGLSLPSHLVINYAMVMASTVALSLVATYRREQHSRQVFLMLSLLSLAEQRQFQANESLRRLADRDPLTGLANRRRFDEEFPRLWKEALRESQPLSVLFIDIDHFKAYNDSYGHAMGDDVLLRFASLLRERTARRPLDLVVRNGGEEFLVVLPGATPEVAAEVARNFLARLADLAIPNTGSNLGVLSASIGVAGGIPLSVQNMQMYVEQADHAMYKAKRNGRNRVELA